MTKPSTIKSTLSWASLAAAFLLVVLCSCRINDEWVLEPRIGASYVDASNDANFDSEAAHYGVWFQARNLVQVNETRAPLLTPYASPEAKSETPPPAAGAKPETTVPIPGDVSGPLTRTPEPGSEPGGGTIQDPHGGHSWVTDVLAWFTTLGWQQCLTLICIATLVTVLRLKGKVRIPWIDSGKNGKPANRKMPQ